MGQLLVDSNPDKFEIVKIFTTRPPRPNEVRLDRTFISSKEFDDKLSRDEFIIHGDFQGNRYGYTAESLKPNGKHLIVNAWPSYTPKFLEQKGTNLIGLGSKDYELLKKRMYERGDSAQTIEERMIFIQRDMADLESVRPLVEKYGKMFDISDNETIPAKVVPWVMKIIAN